MNNTRTYTLRNGVTANDLIIRLCNFLDCSNMETQTAANQDGSCIVLQARTHGGTLKQLVGMDKAVTIRLNQVGDSLNVEVGEAKWGDKAIVMTVSMFVLWPLTVTSGIGIIAQKQLINRIWNQIDFFMIAF